MKRGYKMGLMDKALASKVSSAEFQRKLDRRKVDEIVKVAHQQSVIPPIVLANLPDGRTVCADGQHRLAAWIISPVFPLPYVMVDRGYNDACLDFLLNNQKQTRVSIAHRYSVDPRGFARFVRKLANRYGASIQQVLNTMFGVATRERTLAGKLKQGDGDTVKAVLRAWTRDPRWKTNNSIFQLNGTLAMAGRIVRRARNKKNAISLLLRLDYANGSALANRYGTSGTSQKEMEAFATRRMAAMV